MGNVTQGQLDERIENMGIENLVTKEQFDESIEYLKNQQQERIDKLSVSVFQSLNNLRIDIKKNDEKSTQGISLSHQALSKSITENLKQIARIDRRIDNFKDKIASIQQNMKEQERQQ